MVILFESLAAYVTYSQMFTFAVVG